MENFKISLKKDSPAQRFKYICQVSQKLVKRKWSNVCVVFITKKLVFCPFLCGFYIGRSRQKFYRITLSPCLIPLPSLVHIRAVFEKTSENVFQTHHNIGVKPVGFSPTMKLRQCAHNSSTCVNAWPQRRLTPLFQRTSANICINLISQETVNS